MNEELIYRITRAVYEQLGKDTDEKMVEQLVIDIYRAIEPTVNQSKASDSVDIITEIGNSGASGSSERLIVSVFGLDRPGIVAAVAQILAEAQCSIIDINQTVVQGKFAMVLIGNMSQSRESVTALKDRFRKEGERLGVHIYAQREDLFNAMHRV